MHSSSGTKVGTGKGEIEIRDKKAPEICDEDMLMEVKAARLFGFALDKNEAVRI